MNDNINDLTELTPVLPTKSDEIDRLQGALKDAVGVIAKAEIDKINLAKSTELIRIAQSNLKGMQLASKDSEIAKLKEELKKSIEELRIAFEAAFENLEENKKI